MKLDLLLRVECVVDNQGGRNPGLLAQPVYVKIGWNDGKFSEHTVPEDAQVITDDLVERVAQRVRALFSQGDLFSRESTGVSDGRERGAGLPQGITAKGKRRKCRELSTLGRAAGSSHADKIPDK